ncbi:type IV pilus twitching motility protein PilT [Oceanobacillus bengalensis]|uniref:Type IV pilus twitching motility protein PilT n=1 Tax=Oceanobacillus bengalensis TaxID=1435466 RepID=A0A494YWR5_9BACI|nr:type IV pilus twitching motility protein PilT [Oceanobacillus bengalensis]RKQ14651.1 type IV pilus twitching motility protein PilT [Oceanobacillus bengalensis]
MAYDIDQLLRKAYTMGASDLHLTVNSPPILRINGRLVPEGNEALTKLDTEEMAEQLIPKYDWGRFIEVGEHDFSYYLEKISRFRVNAYHQKQQIGIVARVIPKEIPTIEQLRMPMILEDLAKKPQGLILVTGPTGSGKSTTLAAMINYINHHDAKHIITLEDPIEYVHKHRKSIVNQREVGTDTKSFANGLRAALRQDPDIILVGEMRDHETISTAITAAETGHLVLATLHTNSAAQTINRIIDVFPPHQQGQIRIQLASVLSGIISQRLMPTADRTGRIAATEILINLPSVANLIRNEKVDQINNILQTSRASGMHTLEMSVRELLNRGMIKADYARNFLTGEGDA